MMSETATAIQPTTPATNGHGQAIAEPPKRLPVVPVRDDGPFANLLDTNRFDHLWRVASAFSRSSLVPEHFHGKPENCFIGIQMAVRLGVDPFMFLQACYIVHGRPGIEAKLAIALANKSGLFVGPIRYRMEGQGKTRSCTAYATVRETDDVIEMTVDWNMVHAEGWDEKKGSGPRAVESKWVTMPEVMFRYRSAMLLIRTHCPEVIMGMQSKEELEDTQPQPLAIVGAPSLTGNRRVGASDLMESLAEAETVELSPGEIPIDASDPPALAGAALRAGASHPA